MSFIFSFPEFVLEFVTLLIKKFFALSVKYIIEFRLFITEYSIYLGLKYYYFSITIINYLSGFSILEAIIIITITLFITFIITTGCFKYYFNYYYYCCYYFFIINSFEC